MEIFVKDTPILQLNKQSDLNAFIQLCKSNGIPYTTQANGSIVFDTSLADVTFILRSLSQEDLVRNFVLQVKDQLQKQGSLILVEERTRLNPDLSKALKAEILLSFNGVQTEHTPDINFFYSFSTKEESLQVIAKIVKQIAQSGLNITFNVSGTFKHLLKWNYFKLLNESNIPAVLVEINNLKILTEYQQSAQSWFVNSLSEMFGMDVPLEKLETLIQLFKKLQETKEIMQRFEDSKPVIELLKEVQEAKEFLNQAKESIKAESLALARNLEKADDFMTSENPAPPSEGKKIMIMHTVPGAQAQTTEEANLNLSQEKAEVQIQPSIINKTKSDPEKHQRHSKKPPQRKRRILNPLNPPSDGPVYVFKAARGPSVPLVPTIVAKNAKAGKNAAARSTFTNQFPSPTFPAWEQDPRREVASHPVIPRSTFNAVTTAITRENNSSGSKEPEIQNQVNHPDSFEEFKSLNKALESVQ